MRYYWQRGTERLKNPQIVNLAWLDLTDQEAEAMTIEIVDDFGSVVKRTSTAYDISLYHFTQRADDPGMFHY